MDAPLPTTAGAGSTVGGDDEEGKRIGLYPLPYTPPYKGGGDNQGWMPDNQCRA